MTTTIARLDCWVLRAPIAVPVANAFGAMTNRPAVFLRMEASDGAHGWGEVFANFPQVGAEHRARLVSSIFAPLLSGASDDIAATRALLDARTRRMALQCGEPGPFAQVIGAIDQALWDLAARRAGVPLWKLLGGGPRVRVYASGIGPDDVVTTARAKHAEGYRAFKLKVGFGAQRDVGNLRALREALGDDALIMTDANQAWTAAEAPARIAGLAPFRPHWIEEPIMADERLDAWRALAAASDVPLAAGENMRGDDSFRTMLEARVLRFVQPDVGKWGGISAARDIAGLARLHDAVVCPHWLAGGIGLAASMHMLAACGTAASLAEVDANPNPLREEVFPVSVVDGVVTLGDAPGLGIEPDLARLARYVQK
ncbi:MAG TPA: mandelate racemase/muconate lactonizing enzyme family protein [Casimicrobiaceae bacterium]|nr:mandelate racemase/muconate lactonizing enzyme family protein [Casimicrobiaceae bacterium]